MEFRRVWGIFQVGMAISTTEIERVAGFAGLAIVEKPKRAA